MIGSRAWSPASDHSQLSLVACWRLNAGRWQVSHATWARWESMSGASWTNGPWWHAMQSSAASCTGLWSPPPAIWCARLIHRERRGASYVNDVR